MKRSALIAGLALVIGCASAQRQTPTVAAVFEPGIISTGNVYRGVFTPDGAEFYFFKRTTTDPRREDYRIFVSRRTGNRWSAPDTVNLGGAFSDLYPALSRDGRHLIFSSYRPAPGDTAARPSANLWLAARTTTGWATPVLLPANRSGYYHAQLVIDDAGDLYFKRQTADYRGGVDMVSRNSTGFATADTSAAYVYWTKHLPAQFFLWETTPGHDGSYVLLMVSPRNEAGRPAGGADIWVAFTKNGRWSEARPLQGGVNSPETENFPFYSADRKELFFVREFREFRHVSLSAALGPRPPGF